MDRHNRQWLIIESVVDLAIEPFFFNAFADLYSEIRGNADQACIEKPMEVCAQQKPISDIVSTLA